MSVISNNQLAGASGQGGSSSYEISRSLRFTKEDGAYLSRTPSSVGNRRTWTWSGWVKKHRNGGTPQQIFGQYRPDSPQGDNRFQFYFNSDDQLQIHTYSLDHLKTNRVFRDPSSWYHFVFAVDTTLATADNRMRLYINGVEETSFAARNNPSQNQDLGINTDGEFNIGTTPNAKSNFYIDCSLAEVHFVEGQALAASDFGEYDDNNVWQPKKYSGSYGTNGFHLDFSDTSDLGNDAAGSNNWTPNNLLGFTNTKDYASNWTADSGFYQTNTSDKMFDGDISGNSYAVTLGNSFTWSPSFDVSTGTSFRLYTYPSGGYTSGYTISVGSTSQSVTFSSTSGQWVDLNNLTGLTINSSNNLTITAASGSSRVGVSALEINGEILITNAYASHNDSLIDTPTNLEASSGNNPGNYATWNALTGNTTLSNGNLDSTGKSGHNQCLSTIGMSSGKYYCEITITDDTGYTGVGIGTKAVNGSFLGSSAGGYLYYSSDGNKRTSGTNSSYGNSYTTGDVIGIAFDADGGNLYFYKNGTIQNSGTAAFTGLTSGPYFFAVDQYNTSNIITGNFGQRPFAYTPPTGYKSLCTTNLPDPTIADGSTAMDVRSSLSAQFTINDLGFEPGLVVAKSTSNSEYWIVADKLRNFIGGLRWNDTNAEGSGDAISSVGATGYQSNSNWFTAGRTYATFNWDAGSSTVSNTDGSITSSVRANASAGFSIVAYTANAPNNTIGHGLNAVPHFVITKARDRTDNWLAYHYDLGVNKWLHLNLDSAVVTTSGIWGAASDWTSNTFGVSTSSIEGNNYGSHDFIAYCFAPVAGYSAFGSYTGNGSSDGPFVYTGHRSRFIMIKRTDSAADWVIYDTARGTYNPNPNRLYPNLTDAETSASTSNLAVLSNGFQPLTNNGTFNTSGGTYVYASFAEHPFKTSRAR